MLLVLVVLLGGGYAAAYVTATDKTPRGIRVAGRQHRRPHPRAGRGVAPARGWPTAPRRRSPSTSTVGETVTPAEVGLAVDYVASVHAAGVGRGWEPEWLWNYYTGGGHLDPVVTVSEMTMTDYLAALAARTGKAARDGGSSSRASAWWSTGPIQAGAIDPAAGPRRHRGGVPPGRPDGPDRALTNGARHRGQRHPDGAHDVRQPGCLRRGRPRARRRAVLLQPRDFAAALSMRPEDGTLVPHFDQRRLVALVNAAIAGRAGRPSTRRVAIIDGEPKVIADRGGIELRPRRGDRRLRRGRRAAARRARAPPSSVHCPSRHHEGRAPAEDPRADLDVHDLVRRRRRPQRRHRAGHAADRRHGAPPRARASPSTPRPGPRRGGGGLQSATTLFNAAFLAGLGDLERHDAADPRQRLPGRVGGHGRVDRPGPHVHQQHALRRPHPGRVHAQHPSARGSP